MRRSVKIFMFMLLGVLLVQNSFFDVVSAQESQETKGVECLTCKMPSLEFQTYINFQVELLQALAKAVRQDKEKESYTKVWLFSAGILSIPQNLLKTWKAMFNRAGEDMKDAYQSVKMWSIMLASITTELVTKDGVWWLAILFRNEPFVRERSTLQDIDMSIHDAMWDLWSEWLWDGTISNEVMDDIWELQQKYNTDKGNGLLERFDIKWSIKYKDMVNMMLRLNSIMKNFIAVDSQGIDDKIIEKGWITIKFNKELMDNMYNSYNCAEWISACNSNWQDLANNTKVWSQIKSWFDSSMEKIKKANDELSQAMLSFKSSTKDTFSKTADEESWLTLKQLATLRTVYGIDTTKLSKEQWIWLESLLNWSAGKTAANSFGLKPLDYFSAEAKELREQARKEKEQAKQDAKYLAELAEMQTEAIENTIENTLTLDEDIIALEESLQNTLNSVLAQKQEDKWVFMIYSNISVTRYFVEIGKWIHDIIEKDIGTKDSRWLVKYLWDACESQCSNKGNANCYAQ